MIHEAHWERLAALHPEDVCRRTGATYLSAERSYLLPLLGSQVIVDMDKRQVRWSGSTSPPRRSPGFHATLFAVVYLIEAKDIAPSGDWVTAEALRSGSFFFRGPHVVPTDRIALKYGHDREAFLAMGRRLSGEVVEMGDACIQLPVVPRITVRLVLWLGDDEFPPRVTMLFDRLVDEHVPLDVLHSMTHLVVDELLRAA